MVINHLVLHVALLNHDVPLNHSYFVHLNHRLDEILQLHHVALELDHEHHYEYNHEMAMVAFLVDYPYLIVHQDDTYHYVNYDHKIHHHPLIAFVLVFAKIFYVVDFVVYQNYIEFQLHLPVIQIML